MKPKYIQTINQLPKVIRDNIEVYRRERGEHIFRPLFDEKKYPCICLVCEKPIQREDKFEMFTYRKNDDPYKLPQFFVDIHSSCFRELRKSIRGGRKCKICRNMFKPGITIWPYKDGWAHPECVEGERLHKFIPIDHGD